MLPPDPNPYAPPRRDAEPPILAQPVEESESVLRLEYHLTLEDIIEFNFHHQFHSPPIRRRLWMLRVVGAGSIALGGLLLWSNFAGAGLAAFPPVGMVFMSLFGLILLYSTTASRQKANLRRLLHVMFREGRNANLFSLQRVWVSPRGIRRVSRYVDATYQWPAVEKIVPSLHGVYIYDSAASAIVLPRSAFAGEAEFQHFVETATRFWQEAGTERK